MSTSLSLIQKHTRFLKYTIPQKKRYLKALWRLDYITLQNMFECIKIDKSTLSMFLEPSLIENKLGKEKEHSKEERVWRYFGISRNIILQDVVGGYVDKYLEVDQKYLDSKTNKIVEKEILSRENKGEMAVIRKTIVSEEEWENENEYQKQVTLLYAHLSKNGNGKVSRLLHLVKSSGMRPTPTTLAALYHTVSTFEEVRFLVNMTHSYGYTAPSIYVHVVLKFLIGKSVEDAFVWWCIGEKCGYVTPPVLFVKFLKELKGCFSLLKRVLDRGRCKYKGNAKVVTSVMKGYMLLGEHDQVIDIYNEYVECGGKADGSLLSVVYGSISMHEGIEKGMEFYESVEKSVDLCNTALDLLYKDNRHFRAVKVIDDMKRVGLDTDIYTFAILLNGLLKQEKYEHVIQLVDKVLQYGPSYRYKRTFNRNKTKLEAYFGIRRGEERVNDFAVPYLIAISFEKVLTTSFLNSVVVKLIEKGMCYDLRLWTFLLRLYNDAEIVQVLWTDILLRGDQDERSVQAYTRKQGNIQCDLNCDSKLSSVSIEEMNRASNGDMAGKSMCEMITAGTDRIPLEVKVQRSDLQVVEH